MEAKLQGVETRESRGRGGQKRHGAAGGVRGATRRGGYGDTQPWGDDWSVRTSLEVEQGGVYLSLSESISLFELHGPSEKTTPEVGRWSSL